MNYTIYCFHALFSVCTRIVKICNITVQQVATNAVDVVNTPWEQLKRRMSCRTWDLIQTEYVHVRIIEVWIIYRKFKSITALRVKHSDLLMQYAQIYTLLAEHNFKMCMFLNNLEGHNI